MTEPSTDLIKSLITDVKLCGNKYWFKIVDRIHYTIMPTDVSSVSYLVIANIKSTDLIEAWDVNVQSGDVLTAAVKIDKSQINELKLASYKTRYIISEFNKKIDFKVANYFDPYQLKRALVSFLDNQRVFKMISKYIIHFNKTNGDYWVPSLIGETDSDNNLSYLNSFDFNGVSLVSMIEDKTMYIYDAINNYGTNHVRFINNDLKVTLVIGLVEQNIMVQELRSDDDTTVRQVTIANDDSNLKLSEQDGIPEIVKVFKDVRDELGEVVQYAIWNEAKKSGYINIFFFRIGTHNYNFENIRRELSEDAWKLIKDLPEGRILINDLKH